MRADLEEFLRGTPSIPGVSQLAHYMLGVFGQADVERKTKIPSLAELEASTPLEQEAPTGLEKTLVRPSDPHGIPAISPPAISRRLTPGVSHRLHARHRDGARQSPSREEHGAVRGDGRPGGRGAAGAGRRSGLVLHASRGASRSGGRGGFASPKPGSDPVGGAHADADAHADTDASAHSARGADARAAPGRSPGGPDPQARGDGEAPTRAGHAHRQGREPGDGEHSGKLLECGEKFRAELPAERRVLLLVTIEHSGEVSSAKVTEPAAVSSGLATCLEGQMRRVAFPATPISPS